MNAELNDVITPVEVTIESEATKVELGPAAREALRIEQVGELRSALDAIGDVAAEPLDELRQSQLEDLVRYLGFAERAAGAMWWLIPADVYTNDD